MSQPPDLATFEVDPDDPYDAYPTLDRMLLYASDAVTASLQEADRADRRWRTAFVRWHTVPDDEVATAEAEAFTTWKAADALSHLVIPIIKGELTTGQQATPRWIQRLQYRHTTAEEGPSRG